MSSGLALQPESEPSAIVACTVSRNVHRFDLLIEDMEAELGEGWGDLGFDEARAFLGQPEANRSGVRRPRHYDGGRIDVGMLGESSAPRSCVERA
jgi:pilus assembly protein CpaE